MTKPKDSRTRQAAKEMRTGIRERQIADGHASSGDYYGAHIHRLVAGEHQEKADTLMKLDAPLEIRQGEVMPEGVDDHTWLIRDTLKEADTAARDASIKRTDLLLMESADLAATGIDAAATIGAENSLEKMLAHQLALCHEAVFKLSDKALSTTHSIGNPYAKQHDQQFASTESTRLLNAAARLMNTYQQGLLTIQKLRTGGKQIVTVQHVNVGAGGQAVIGNVQTGGGQLPGGGSENG